MVQIKPFGVEEWMDAYETLAKYNLGETCCASISLDDLQGLSEEKEANIFSRSTKMTYGEIRGSKDLRTNLARLYSSKVATPLPEDNILITPGAIAANHLVFYALLGPGDHVICHYPTYQQLYDCPASFGAEVDLWRARPEASWIPDLSELEKMIKPNTKLIVLNNPNNPTGAVLPRPMLTKIIELAESKNIMIMSDEVYRPIFHSISPMSTDFPPSILSMGYTNTIATGSLSKAYSLAGIRVGWIASRNPEIIEKIASARHYTTLSVSQLDSSVAAFALSPHAVHALIGRNIQLAKMNLEILEKFVIKHDDICEWTKPIAGTTAFLRFHRDGKAIDDLAFCRRLVQEAGVLWAPGSFSFGEEHKGYVRIGYVCETDVLKDGLDQVRMWLKKEFDSLEVVE